MEVMSTIQFILSVGLLVSICYFCELDVILYAIPLGLITSIVAGGEIVCAYHRMVLNASRFAKLRFTAELCIHLMALVSYVAIFRLRFDTLWSIAVAYYCCVVICQIIWSIVTPNDPDIKYKASKTLWLDKVRNDPLTSDVIEEEYYKERGDEDWHGL